MFKVDPSKQIHWYSPWSVPVGRVDPGEIVTFTCQDTWNDVMTTTSTIQARAMLGHPINPVNGPVYVNGAMPGDTLKITIEDVRVTSDATLICNDIQVSRAFRKYITDDEVVKFPIHDGKADMFGTIVELKPFPGCLGVAPAERMSTLDQGSYGGNMDCKKMTKGTKLYLPVSVPGALVATGDIHAYQGDGEIVAGLEVAGEIDLSFEIIKNKTEPWPILETEDRWYAIVSRNTLEDAGMDAVQCIQEFILKRTDKYTPNHLMLLLAELGDVEVCQMVDTYMTMRFSFEKRIAPELQF
ncbi:MAG: acetamidase/formamidase family protein [Clostridia bacterium]|nr:acetamidase/formamidase family protein [Clostridia bacterium]